MVLGINLIAMFFALNSVQVKNQSSVTETVALQHHSASEIVRLFDSKGGREPLDNFNINLKTNSIEVIGPRRAVEAFKAFAKERDKQQRFFWISADIYRVSVDRFGTVSKELLNAPKVGTSEEIEASMSVTGGPNIISMRYTPKVLDSGNVSVQTSFIIKDKARDIDESYAGAPELVPGGNNSVIGLQLTGSPDIRKRIKRGEIVKDSGPYSAIYVEIKLDKVQ